MRKIIDYLTVVENDLTLLDELVRKCIQEGFEPFGNLIVCPESEWEFIQPMVRYGQSDNKGCDINGYGQ